MADPISVASGVVALIGFGIQTGKSLRTLLDSFINHTKIVRDLKNDLSALDRILAELHETVDSDAATELASLQLPLHSCGQLCQEFDALVRKCATSTTDNRRSVRDWTRLQLRSDEINTFRVSLSGYKSTVQVALGGINLRSSQVTLQALEGYKDVIEETRTDLKAQLSRIETQLSTRSDSALTTTAYLEWATSQQRTQEEKDSILQCLRICEAVALDIDRCRSTMVRDVAVPADTRHDSVVTPQTGQLPPATFTASKLNECRDKISAAKIELESRLRTIGGANSDENPSVEARVRTCLTICEEALVEAGDARICTYEDVSTEEDSRQYIVSTVEDLISAKRIKTGARSVMIMGQMSDQSLQLSFQALSSVSTHGEGSNEPGTARLFSFEKYGAGHQLSKRSQTP